MTKTETLECALTADEIGQRGRNLSTTLLEHDAKEEQKKDAAKEFAEELKAFRLDMKILSQTIRRGTELRKVEVEVRMHTPRPGMKRTVCLDTGAVVRDEQMTEAERQASLFEEERQLEGMFGAEPDGKSMGAGR